MSAFLALFVEGKELNEKAALAAWKTWGANSLLRTGSNKRRVLSANRRNVSRLPQSYSSEKGRSGDPVVSSTTWSEQSSGEDQQEAEKPLVCGESGAACPEPSLVVGRGSSGNPLASAMGNS